MIKSIFFNIDFSRSYEGHMKVTSTVLNEII